MLSRNALASKYNLYTRTLHNAQTTSVRARSHFTKENLQELFNKIEATSLKNKSIKKYKDTILQSNLLQTCNKALASIQDKFNSEKNNEATDRKKILPNQLFKKKFMLSSFTVAAVAPTITVEPIPEPPPVPAGTEELVSPEIINQLNALGEPTFVSLGLAGHTPVGVVQTCFEFLHVTWGIPWWEAIAMGTLFIRFMMFPLVIVAQRNAAKMNNYMPQMQTLQMKMTEARQTGNQLEAAKYSQELMIFMKQKGLNPLKNMVVPLAQMPIFVSFFMALRQMANVPVESLTTGGLWWFVDLTVPDQFFIMPLITSATLYATIELGTDTAKLSSQNLQTMKYVLRALPLVILPFIVNFPGAILCYWVSSNFISLAQVGILRIPTVRDYFKIEPLITHRPETLPVKPKGFTEGIKDSWTNIKITQQLEERRRLDEMQFQRAGKGPLVKTYKYDPTKQGSPAQSASAISAKRR